MLIPLVVDLARAGARKRPRRKAGVPAVGATGVPELDVPEGVRYQLFRALRAMGDGHVMVVRRRLPVFAVDPESAARARAFLRTLRDPASWRGASDLEAIFVPGTAFPGLIGKILIGSGWCEPSAEPHYIPNLRTFLLTERGYETLDKARCWWSSLGFGERLRLMLTE